MGTIMLVGAGIFIGWLLFRSKEQPFTPQKEAKPSGGRAQAGYIRQPEQRNISEPNNANQNSHTLRNVAGGMVAGAVLGHMLSGDKKAEAHETNNFYNSYNDYYDHDELAGEDYDEDYDEDEDYTSDYDYDTDDYDSDDYSEYDSSYDDDYDSSSDWGSDSYDDGGDW